MTNREAIEAVRGALLELQRPQVSIDDLFLDVAFDLCRSAADEMRILSRLTSAIGKGAEQNASNLKRLVELKAKLARRFQARRKAA
jgi:hypothetical protein